VDDDDGGGGGGGLRNDVFAKILGIICD